MTARRYGSRAEYKAAGRAFGEESAGVVIRHLTAVANENPATLTAEYVDARVAELLAVLGEAVRGHLAIGAPPDWVAKFRAAFLRIVSARLQEAQLATGALVANDR